MAGAPDQKWLDSQNGAIGCCLLDVKLVPLLLERTRAEDFATPARTVWIAFSQLQAEGKVPDVISVNERLHGDYQEYLAQLMEITPTTAAFDGYIDAVRQRAVLHRVKTALLDAAGSEDLGAMQEALDRASQALASQKDPSEKGDIVSLMLDFMERKENPVQYMDTGFPSLNRYTFLDPGDTVIIGGAPSAGKTALAIQLAITQSVRYRVCFYSGETNRHKITDRFMALCSGIDLGKIKTAELTGDDWLTLTSTASRLSSRSFWVQNCAGWTVDEIFRDAVANRYEVIYIDYLQLVKGKSASRYETVTDISVSIHQQAQRTRILTVALSQLSRVEQGERPTMSDLRESGQIEQDADVIMLLYQPTKRMKETISKQCNRVLDIVKNKENEVFPMQIHFDGPKQQFTAISNLEAPEPRKPRSKQSKRLPDDTPVPEESTKTTMQEATHG